MNVVNVVNVLLAYQRMELNLIGLVGLGNVHNVHNVHTGFCSRLECNRTQIWSNVCNLVVPVVGIYSE